MTGGSLNQIYNVDKKGDVSSSQAQPSFDFLASAVKQQQESLRSAVGSLDSGSGLTLSGIPQGTTAVVSGSAATASAFVTGTNQVVSTNGSNPLLKTPYASSLISPSATIASREVKNFINETNLAVLSESPGYAGTSTPPAPV